MALSKAHASAKAADVTKLFCQTIKHRVTHFIAAEYGGPPPNCHPNPNVS